MHIDRMLLHWLWRQLNYQLSRSMLSDDARQRARDELDEKLHDYEEACRKSRGPVESRNNHWAWVALQRKRELEKRLES